MTKARELAKLGEVMTNSQIGGRRNIAYNGGMNVSQRATSSTSVTSSEYLVDRFQAIISGMGTWTLSQSTTAPDGFSNSFKYECTVKNDTPSSAGNLACKQRIEGQDLQHLKYGTSSPETITISFYVRSNKTGTYIFELLQPDASNRHRGASYTINSADTWEKKVITFTGDTSGVINNDTGDAMQLTWWLGSGSGFSSGTLQTDWGALDQTARAVGNVNLADTVGNEWYITGVQMEVGSYPNGTPFEHRSYAEELLLCQRYYCIITDSSVNNRLSGTSTSVHKLADYSFPVTMRTTPTASELTAPTLLSCNSLTPDMSTTNVSFRVNPTSATGYYAKNYVYDFNSEL